MLRNKNLAVVVIIASSRQEFGRYEKRDRIICLWTFWTEHHAMKEYWVVELALQEFLSLALYEGEWSVSHPGRFTPRERSLASIA